MRYPIFGQHTGLHVSELVLGSIGHWQDGGMDEEYLFWDNQEFMKGIGLGK